MFSCMLLHNFYLFALYTSFSATTLSSGKIAVQSGLTRNFRNWLMTNGYSDYSDKFARDDLKNDGSFGGKSYSDQPINKRPIVFIHGNSASALGIIHKSRHFREAGRLQTAVNYLVHSCSYVLQLRKFIEAVLQYTGASKIDIISHSMGVTLARKVAQGGHLREQTGNGCDIGEPLTNRVRTFVGIAGGNRGLESCYFLSDREKPSCNPINGFYPGFCPQQTCPGNAPGLSVYLRDLNDNPGIEGQYICSIWSKADNMIQHEDLVFGYPTSRILNQTAEKVYDSLTHMELKDQTMQIQFEMVSGSYYFEK